MLSHFPLWRSDCHSMLAQTDFPGSAFAISGLLLGFLLFVVPVAFMDEERATSNCWQRLARSGVPRL